jgi:hypothetical protein
MFDEINTVENFVRDLLSGSEMGWFQIDGRARATCRVATNLYNQVARRIP